MADYLCTINGIERQLRLSSLQIRERINSLSFLTGDIISEDGTYRPDLDDEIVITEAEGSPARTIFGGIIDQAEESAIDEQVAIDAIVTRINAADFSVFADRRFVNATIPAGTMKSQAQYIQQLLSPYGVTLDAGQVDGPTMPALVCSFRKASDVLNDISTLTASFGPQYLWKIGYDKVLSLFQIGNRAAPVDLIEGAGVEVGDLAIKPTRGQYANRVILRVGGSGTVDIRWHEFDNGDDELSKYYGSQFVTIGAYRTVNVQPLIASIIYGTKGIGSLKLVYDPDVLPNPSIGANGERFFPQALTPFADGTDFGEAGRRWFHERTYDIPADEPDLFLPLNESSGGSAGDAGAGGNDGTVQGSATQGRLGVTFDGVNDRIDISGQTNFGDTWSFECEFTPDSAQSDTRGLLFGEQASGDGVVWNKTSLKVEVRDGGSTIAQSSALVSGSKYKLFVSCDAGAVTIYINSLADGTGSGFNVAADPDGIGGDSSNAFSFKGTIRNVAYYPGEAFSADDVLTHYNRTIDRIMQALTDTAIPSDGYLSVAYTGQYPIVVVVQDDDEIASRGLWEIVVDVAQPMTAEASHALADSLLARYTFTPREARYKTVQLGLEPGQTQTITSAKRSVNSTFLITEVVTTPEPLNLGLIRAITAIEGDTARPGWQDVVKQWSVVGGGSSSASAVTIQPSVQVPSAPVSSSLSVVKTANESVTSSDVLQDDNELFFAVGPNERWSVVMWLIYDATTTGDLKTDWSLPSGSSGVHGGLRLIVPATGPASGVNANGTSIGTPVTMGGVGAGVVAIASMYAAILTGSVGGNVKFQWAQGTSTGTASTLQAGSLLVATLVG